MQERAKINELLLKSSQAYALFDNYYVTKVDNAFLNCDIINIPVPYNPVLLAYAIKKQSPYFNVFWYHMMKLQENGDFDITVQRYETQNQICPDYSGEPIKFGQCFTAFLVLMGGLICGFVLLM